jgi:hypothetical protein
MREQLGAAVGCNGRAETSDILQTANIQYTGYVFLLEDFLQGGGYETRKGCAS